MTLRHVIRSLPITLLLLIAVVGMAHAQSSRLYFAGYMGLNTFGNLDYEESATPSSGDIEPENAFSFAGALGLRIDNNWRVEAEVSYRKSDLASIAVSNRGAFDMNGDLSSTLLMASIYYDVDLDWKNLMPYVTAGLGVAFHDANIDDTSGFAADASGDDFGVAWQIGTGLKYRVTDDLAFTGGYRYLGTSQMTIADYDINNSSHEFRVGLEYDLPFK